MLARIPALRLVGIQNRQRLRQPHRRLRKVMIGHDQVQPQRLRRLSSGKRPNPRIDTDHQPHAIARERLKHLALHAVALAQSMRNMKARLPAQHLDGSLQQHHCRRPVHVVVAVDQDRLPRGNRVLNTRYRPLHAQHRVGVVQVLKLWMKESLRLGRRAHSARHQQFGNQQRQPGLACQGSGRTRIALRKYPAPAE